MKTKAKWYNIPEIVGNLLMILPPLGIYGVYRSETIASKWKKVTTVTLILVSTLLALIVLN